MKNLTTNTLIDYIGEDKLYNAFLIGECYTSGDINNIINLLGYGVYNPNTTTRIIKEIYKVDILNVYINNKLTRLYKLLRKH